MRETGIEIPYIPNASFDGAASSSNEKQKSNGRGQARSERARSRRKSLDAKLMRQGRDPRAVQGILFEINPAERGLVVN
jgi:hypothetical protein